MNQANATIRLDVGRLNFKTATIHARQLHSVVIRVERMPDDVTSAYVRIFNVNAQTYYDVQISRRPNGEGIAYAIGTVFPATGSSKYEIHAYDARGNMTALGAGLVEIEAFSTSATPSTAGASVPIQQIPDSTGALHQISAVYDSETETWNAVISS